MGGLLAGLAALAAPITARVLIALGFSVVTIGGVTLAWGTVKSAIVAGFATGAPYIALAGMGGVWVALGAVVGAMSFAVAFWSLTSSVRILGLS